MTTLPEGNGGEEAPLNYSNPSHGKVDITRERLLAARSCTALGALLIVLATCVGLSFAMTLAGQAGGLIASVVFLMFLVMLASGIAYLIGGIRIRRGGMISVIVCLVLAGLQLLYSLFALVVGAIAFFTVGRMNVIGVVIYLIAVAAFAQLVYYLVKILRQPRLPE
jgi:hypothetical protein